MKRTLARVLFGLLAFMLCCEGLLRLLPVSSSTESGYHFDDMILTYPAHHEWQVATGWDLRNGQRMRSNNVGFAAHRDFVHDARAVALIGDSFVEASMLAQHDRLGPQLERALGDRPVYSMGGPGSSLLDYAERIRFAHDRFGVKDFVLLLERGDVRQALCGSGNVHAACLDPRSFESRTVRQPPPSLAKRVLRHSALAQYLFSQLKVSPSRLVRDTFSRKAPAHATTIAMKPRPSSDDDAATPSPQVDVVAATFFERARPYVTGRLIIVMDSNRSALRAGQSTVDADRARFIALARAAGAEVVDSEPIFTRHFATSPLSLDVGPYDAHLNGLAVDLLAQAVSVVLKTPVMPRATSKDSPRV